jgi:Cu/Zn superoxide dismutase
MRVDLYGLNANAKQYHVHVSPINSTFPAADSCSAASVGGHFNPKGVTGTCNPAQPETCEYGDLSGKFGELTGLPSVVAKEYTSATLPLSGADSIVGRSIVIHRDDATGSRWVCANIVMRAEASFSMGGVAGTIVFTQANSAQRTQVQLSLSGLAKQAGQYHVHVTPIAGGVASGQECSGASVGGHFNPRGGTLPCDPLAPSKCEVGDLSGKHGNFSELETVSTSYSDDSIVLSGVETVVGRSIVIHKNDANNSRWVCADIKWKDPAAAPTAAPTFAPTAVPSLSPGSAPHLRGRGLWMARMAACRGCAHEWLAAHCGTRCVQVRAT